MTLLSWLAFSCPLILCALGALFSEYAGCLALFLDGLVSFAAFLHYTFTVYTGSAVAATFLACLTSIIITGAFSLVVEKFGANRFIAAMAMNLLFGALTTALSWLLFNTRGVLAADVYRFGVGAARLATVSGTAVMAACAVVFLRYGRHGLYIRVAGSDADVLLAKGVNPSHIRSLSWCLAALFGSLAGCFLGLRLSSFVPNISSGRGWMALAAVFLGRKKPVRIIISVFIFCFADLLAANIQNYIQGIPNSFLISLPYLVSLILILVK